MEEVIWWVDIFYEVAEDNKCIAVCIEFTENKCSYLVHPALVADVRTFGYENAQDIKDPIWLV